MAWKPAREPLPAENAQCPVGGLAASYTMQCPIAEFPGPTARTTELLVNSGLLITGP